MSAPPPIIPRDAVLLAADSKQLVHNTEFNTAQLAVHKKKLPLSTRGLGPTEFVTQRGPCPWTSPSLHATACCRIVRKMVLSWAGQTMWVNKGRATHL